MSRGKWGVVSGEWGIGCREWGAGSSQGRRTLTGSPINWLKVLAAAVILLPPPSSLLAQDAERGRPIYEQWCAGCHGENGAGDGEAVEFMVPRPRDFTGAVYQIRTTASGELPTDDDLRKVIDTGMPGTTMPGWSDRLNARERDDVIAYIKSFSHFFGGPAPEPIDAGNPPRITEEGLVEGRQLFVEGLECAQCHGDAGRGDGTSAPDLTDDWDNPIRATDLTENWNFNGGGSVADIYMRLRTGLDGTPMPTQSDVIDAGIITDEQLWFAAQYVRSLSPPDVPEVREVIRARLIEGEPPNGPGDESWNEVESYYVPLVGQIIVKPRWFAPTVDGVWVQAVHNGEHLAIRLTWHDPTNSPDPAWDVFFHRMVQTVTDVDGPHIGAQGPDIFALQFPLREEEGSQLPYFLGGDTRRPVYMLRWESSPDRLREGSATGLGTLNPAGSTAATHAASFEEGEWSVQINRALASDDTSVAPSLSPGIPIPIGFYAADGTSGEDDSRGAVSAWYSIYLDVPTPPSVYITPVIAAILTAGLGMVVVWRAQRNQR